MKFHAILLASILITSLVGLSNFDNAFAQSETKHYKIYHEPWPDSYADDYNPIQGAIEFWEKQRPDLSFSIVSSAQEANTFVHWVKEKGEHWAGLSYGSLILVELGDTKCGGQWNQFHPSYVQNIIAHEIGHRLGYGHETQSDSIMNSGGRLDKHYSKISFEKFLDPSIGPLWYQTCVYSNGSTLSYSIESLSGYKHGFDLIIVPTYSDLINVNYGKSFSHYDVGKCISEGSLAVFNAECKVGPGSYLVIKPKGGLILLKITMEEKNFPIKQYTVYKQYGSYKQPDPADQGKLELANLRFEQSGISTTTFVMGEKVKVTYLVKNSQKTAQNFFHIVEAISESGKSEKIALKSSIIQPEEETPYLETWRPVESGEYKIKVSVLDSSNHDIELASPLERLVTVQDNLGKYRFLKAHTGIQLGNTCITMIKNNLTTKCPTYEELLSVFSDTSNRKISGDFVVKDGYLHRDFTPIHNQFEYYRTETKELMFIDPPSDMLKLIKLIVIEPSITEYKIDGQTITNNTLLFGTARSENSDCSEVKISAVDWYVLLGDTVNYVKHNCDKAFTNYDTIKKKSWPRTIHDITTTYKYQYDLWLKNAIEECGKNYCIPK